MNQFVLILSSKPSISSAVLITRWICIQPLLRFKKAESIASRCYFERFLINASMPGRSDLERMYCLWINLYWFYLASHLSLVPFWSLGGFAYSPYFDWAMPGRSDLERMYCLFIVDQRRAVWYLLSTSSIEASLQSAIASHLSLLYCRMAIS
jgi:hypothetical protein